MTYARLEGVLVEFSLPDASNQVGFDGEVHLKWSMLPNARLTTTGRSIAATARVRPRTGVETNKPEDRVAAVLARMPAGASATFAEHVATAQRERVPVTLFPPVHPVPLALTALPPPPRLARPLSALSVHDPVVARKRLMQQSAVCAAFSGNVPGYRSACASPAPIRRRQSVRSTP